MTAAMSTIATTMPTVSLAALPVPVLYTLDSLPPVRPPLPLSGSAPKDPDQAALAAHILEPGQECRKGHRDHQDHQNQ